MTTIPERIREEARKLIPDGVDAACRAVIEANAMYALLAAEKRGREEEAKIVAVAISDELVTIYEDSPDIDIECNNLCRRLLAAIRSTN